MKKYQDNIDKQFEFNQGKNLFYNGILSSLRFSPETLNAIEKIDLIDSDSENLLIDYLTNRAVQEFCKVNQYYTFDKQAQLFLRSLYVDLFTNIKKHKSSIESIAENHYDNLIKWLQETNSFAEKNYTSKGEIIESVACVNRNKKYSDFGKKNYSEIGNSLYSNFGNRSTVTVE